MCISIDAAARISPLEVNIDVVYKWHMQSSDVVVAYSIPMRKFLYM
jgi:hypothetical protein